MAKGVYHSLQNRLFSRGVKKDFFKVTTGYDKSHYSIKSWLVVKEQTAYIHDTPLLQSIQLESILEITLEWQFFTIWESWMAPLKCVWSGGIDRPEVLLKVSPQIFCAGFSPTDQLSDLGQVTIHSLRVLFARWGWLGVIFYSIALSIKFKSMKCVELREGAQMFVL